MMSKKLFIFLVILMSLSLVGIVFVQGYFIDKSFKNEEERFSLSVRRALAYTSERVTEIEYNKYFDHPQIYGGGPYQDERDDGYRFTLFSRAAIDLCSYLNWIPELLHCHDWTTSLIPVYLNETDFDQPIGRAADALHQQPVQRAGALFGDQVFVGIIFS